MYIVKYKYLIIHDSQIFFSQSVGCLSTYLMPSFEVQQFLILMKSHFSSFVVSYAFCCHLRNHYLTQTHKGLYLCFLLRVLWFEHFD